MYGPFCVQVINLVIIILVFHNHSLQLLGNNKMGCYMDGISTVGSWMRAEMEWDSCFGPIPMFKICKTNKKIWFFKITIPLNRGIVELTPHLNGTVATIGMGVNYNFGMN